MQTKLPVGKQLLLPVKIKRVADIGSLIQVVRKDQGMTQLDIAGLGGTGNRFIVDLEKGKETVQMQKVLDVLALLGLELVVQKKNKL